MLVRFLVGNFAFALIGGGGLYQIFFFFFNRVDYVDMWICSWNLVVMAGYPLFYYCMYLE